MEHTETYHGHRIEVTLTKVHENSWTWSYDVDGETFGKSRRPLPDAETAMRLGLGAARARVDELEG